MEHAERQANPSDLRSRDRADRRHISTACLVVVTTLWIATAVLGAEPSGNPPVYFTDVTASSGIDFVQTIGDDHMSNIVESAGVGCAFLDYDNDGWMDVYLVNGYWREGLSDPEYEPELREKLAKASDRLYRNRGNGTFEDVTKKAGLERQGYGMGVSTVDFDGDGDTDIYVTNFGPNFLFRNNGDGTFTETAEKLGVHDPRFSVGAVFLDYDHDGRLDLFVGNYIEYDPDYDLFYAPDGFPGPLAYTGQFDGLYRARPDGTFEDVSEKAGIRIRPKGRAMGVGAIDFDADGLLDIFVSNDAMENFLFHNTGKATFEDVALIAGVAYGGNGDATAAMGVEIIDYDGDGRLDIFVPDMGFCCLYRNAGGAIFEDRAASSGIAAVMGQYIGWGALFSDFNLDGRIDLYISNGDVHHLEPHEDVVFLGDGKGRFTDVSETAGEWSREKFTSRGVSGADFDNDGDMDLIVTNLNDRPVLLRNDTPRNGNHWLFVSLKDQGPNTQAIGATVTVRTGDRVQTRLRTTTGGYLSQHDPRLHFGLGKHRKADRVEITWPDGTKQTLENVPADRVLTVVRKAKVARTNG